MTLTSENFNRFQPHNKTGSFTKNAFAYDEMISQKNPSKAQTQFVGNQIFILVLNELVVGNEINMFSVFLNEA